MKKLFERLCTAAMLSAVLFAACTPSEEDSPAPTFPDPVEGVFDLEAEGGNIKTITFNANYKWTVSIPVESSTEFGILTEEGHVLTSLSGPAGEGSVQIVCLLDYQDLEEHSVVVSMTMESETREIASFVLYSSTPVFKFRMAEFKGEDYTQSTDEESAFEHVFVDLPSDGKVPMVWSAADAGYIAYVQVEANFDTNIPNSGLSVYENASSGRFTEYKLVCNTVNYDNADGVGYTFTVKSNIENYESNDCALLAPQFEPLLEVRKAVVGENGNFQYGDVYNWVYEDEPLEQSSQIDLVYRPDFNNAIDMYLLVKSNFPATVSGPKWLAVADPQAQTTSTDYVLENVYQISADPATMTLAQETGTLSFGFGTYSVSYGVAHDDYSDLFTIDHYEVPTFNFDVAGEFAAQEMGSQEATVGLVSSGDLDFYIFNKTPYGNYQSKNADWVTTEYSWQTGTETVAAPVIQNNTLTIDAAVNDGEDPREAIVVAYPKAKASEVEEWPSPEYFFLNDYQNGLKDEYAKYLCAYVTQDGQAEPVEAVGLDDMWPALQWDGLITSFDVLSDDGSDKLFSTFPDVPAYLITYEASFAQLPDYPFGDNCEFTVNVKYDSYKVYDASMKEIKTPASHWATLEESKWAPGNRYLGVLTDKSMKSESSYFVFFSGSTAVAAIKLDYTYDDGSSSGGSIVLEFDTMYGQVDESVCQLTELTGGDKVPEDIASCWCLTVNATTATAPGMVALKGLPEGGSWETKTIDGIEINNWGSTVIYLSDPPKSVDDYVRYMDASGNYVLSLVFKVNITE